MTKDLADELERLAKALFDEPDAARRIYRSVALSLWVENNLPRIISAGDELDKAKAENARMREALEMIADGSAPPIPHGQYLAHRPVMDLARQALTGKDG